MASKRKPVSIDTKLQALDEVDKKVKSKTQIAKEYGVPSSTLSTWLKNKDALRKAHGNFAPARKRIRTAKHSDVESALLMWFKNARAQKIPISGPVLQEKAKEYAKGLGISDFQCSDGWLHGLKRRYDIQFRVISGESGDLTSQQTDQWTIIL